MIASIFDLNLVQILDWVLIVCLFLYLVFSALVIWQIRLLVTTVKTNLSTPILVLSLANLVISFLCLVAAVGLL